MSRLSIIFAAVAIGCTGCGPTLEQRSAANYAQYEQAIAKSNADYDAAMRRIRAKSAECINRLSSMQIGSAELSLRDVSCKASKINTTKVGSATIDQWVYEFPDDRTIYMYYRNERLAAIQY
jgi:hypothetical protein